MTDWMVSTEIFFHCKNMSRSPVVKYQNSVPASNEFSNKHLPYAEQSGYPLYNFMYNVRPNRLLAQFTLEPFNETYINLRATEYYTVYLEDRSILDSSSIHKVPREFW